MEYCRLLLHAITVLSVPNIVLGANPGEACDPRRDDYHILPANPQSFLACELITRRWTVKSCASISGDALKYNKALQYCIFSDYTGSRVVGETCKYNTDCVGGGYCNGQYCTCRSSFIAYNGYCYEKRNPGEGGCLGNVVGDRQCTAVWPNTKCQSGRCVCCDITGTNCNLPIVQTRDGAVCLNQIADCPLGGIAVKLITSAGNIVPCAITNGIITGCDPADVIGTTSTKNLYLFDCIQTTVSYCCPNRASTCMQPKVGEDSNGGLTRWYYNSVSGTCMQFQWNSAVGNSNNFLTQNHCQSYCDKGCDRGDPEYSTSVVSNQQIKNTCTTGGSGCNTNTHDCVNKGSEYLCCPQRSFICSSQGGVIVPDGSAVMETGFLCLNAAPSTRYRYNPSIQRCEPLTGYLGCGGTFNNFVSQQDCERFCRGLVCPRGSPLTDSNGGFISCGGSVVCASTHYCYKGSCCPTKQTVCSEVKVIGQCQSYQTRYWFNTATQQCTSFYYSGCQGNENNFETALKCQNFCRGTTTTPQCSQGSAYKDIFGKFAVCSTNGISAQQCPVNYECYFNGNSFGCCPTKDYVCSQSSSAGNSCGPKTTRWFYDQNSHSCQTFEYFGCDGNPNNFPNQDLCKQYCGVGNCPYGGTPYRDGTGVVRVCGSTAGSCPNEHDCTSVQLGISTVNYCCPRRSYVCRLPPLTGTSCGQSVSRWYYNFALKTCAQFTYGGCSGNANSFFTQKQCRDYCASSACLAGEIASMMNGIIQSCNPSIPNTCASGYFCRADPTQGQNICCGSGTQGVCPINTRAYVDPFEGAVRKCIPSNMNSCPGDFLCLLVPEKQSYYCCAPTGGFCPAGQTPYSDSSTGAMSKCLLNTFGSCPTNYQCQSAISGSLYGYCCSTAVTAQCPSGTTAYVDSTTQRPFACTVGVTVCPDTRYVCQSAIFGRVTGFCCTSTTIVPTNSANALLDLQPPCPEGFKATLNPSLSQQYFPMPCAIGGPQICYGYGACMYRSGNLYAYCCELDVDKAQCPKGYQLETIDGYYDDKLPRACAVQYSESACKSPYECLKSSQDAPLAFCCKRNSTSSTTLSSTALTTPFSTAQPQSSTTQIVSTVIIRRRYLLCPNGQIQYTIAGTSSPQICQTFTSPSNCPTGFFCQYNSATAQSYCCALDAGCPTLSYPSIDATTGQIKGCTGVNSCSAGFSCSYSAKQNRNICCSSSSVPTTVQYCPTNSNPLLIAGTMNASPCTIGVTVCPPPYICQSAAPGAAGYCCTTGASQSQTFCPSKSEPYFYPSTQTPQSCAIGSTVCLLGYTCQRGPNGGTYCCTGTSTPSLLCPSNSSPFYFQGTTSVQICQLGSNTCTQGYLCQRGSTGQSICCSSNNVTPANYCPPATTPYYNSVSQLPVVCTLGSSVCPNAYSCQRGPSGSFYCCSGGTTIPQQRICPNNNRPYYFPGTQTPRTCNTGSSGGCNTGYTCQKSPVDSFSYCCTGISGSGSSLPGNCPASTTPYFYPGTQLALGCPNGGQCPPPATCQFGVCCSRNNLRFSSVRTTETFDSQCKVMISGVVCNPYRSGNDCPNGYDCQYNQVLNSYRCCDDRNSQRKVSSIYQRQNKQAYNKDGNMNRICPPNHIWLRQSNNRSQCHKILRPGEFGCISSVQCTQGRCALNGECRCANNRMLFVDKCVTLCPRGTRNYGGICNTL